MAKQPTQEDFMNVIDEQADELEKQTATATPIGNYTKARVNAFSKALTEFSKLLTDVIGPDAPQMPPMSMIQKDIVQGKLPVDLVTAYLAIASISKEYSKVSGIEFEFPQLSELINDGMLALATESIYSLAKDRDIKKYLASPAPSAAEPEKEMEMKEEKTNPNISQEQKQDLDMLMS